jgi:hypothetical protein
MKCSPDCVMDFDIEDITDIYSKEMRSMTDEKK